MMQVINKTLCSGCMACMNVCPKEAIVASEDEFGFVYPVVNSGKCINCGLCDGVCDWKNEKNECMNTRNAYSLKHRDKGILYKSTSGGAFTALSDSILDQGGVVFAAFMDQNFNVMHVSAETKEQRDAMRGSKYVQSSIGFTFREAKRQIEANRAVMFVGTPCQTAGLMCFLNRSYDNLLIVDFLCHGVPNNSLFKAHIHYLEIKKRGKANGHEFRGKRYGWSSPYIETISFEKKGTFDGYCAQCYLQLFLNSTTLRPSCFNCRYRSRHRYSDITIADFWGIEKITGNMDTQGVSLVLANTENAEEHIHAASGVCKLVEVPYEKIAKRISTTPPIPSSDPETFWQDYVNIGYEGVVKKYADTSLKSKGRFVIKKIYRKAKCRNEFKIKM